MTWQSFPLPKDLSEEEMDSLINILKRAMPLKQFRKRGVNYYDDDDIPF